MSASSRRILLSAALLASSAVVSAAIFGIHAHIRADDIIASSRVELPERRQFLNSMRAPLRPIGVPNAYGDAWECYRKAFKAYSLIPKQRDYHFSRLLPFLPAINDILENLRAARQRETVTLPGENDPESSILDGSCQIWDVLIPLAHWQMENNEVDQAVETLYLAQGLSMDLRWYTDRGIYFLMYLQDLELRSNSAMILLCAAYPLTAERFARISSYLDLLAHRRPSIVWNIRWHDVAWRQTLLDNPSDWKAVDEDGVGWRTGYSSHITRASWMRAIMDVTSELQVLDQASSTQWAGVLKGILHKYSQVQIPLIRQIEDAVKKEVDVLRSRVLLRLSMAISRFAERFGRVPVTLEELVPSYSEKIPRCPRGGEAFAYESGRVWCKE